MTTAELLLSAWSFDPVLVPGCAAAVLAYAAPPRPKSASRVALLSAATLILVFASASPIGTLADGYLFSAHMLQHLLLLLVVPPLALLGVGAESSDRRLARRPRTVHVSLAWLAGVSAMWLWHAPRLCDAAARSGSIHRVQELSLVAMGLVFWWPVLAPHDESRIAPLAGVVYLFTACTACTILGIAITFSPVEVCSVYAHPVDRLGALALLRGGWGLTPERDQELGGLFMWVPACLVYGAGILGILARWYRAPEDPQADEPAPTTLEEGR